MVEKALAYAGIQSGEQVYEFHPVNISAVIEAAIHKAKRLFQKIILQLKFPLIRNSRMSLDKQLSYNRPLKISSSTPSNTAVQRNGSRSKLTLFQSQMHHM